MPEIQIGKYTRPGIYFEEYDNSQIDAQSFEGIRSLVIGVSKKGPVNTPVLLQSHNDLKNIFGPLDRSLESKGSYFHRTAAKLLETKPVVAINLLATDDELDLAEYQSLSSSSKYFNDIVRQGAYSKFHNTTGFWNKDTDSFLNLVDGNTGNENRLFHMTNLSDRKITVFIIKSQRTDFDISLLEWYGRVEDVPLYVNPNDFASDYLVDVMILNGDWSNYDELSVDPVWSKYFNRTGLIKSQVTNFYNDRNVSLIKYYSGLSLIPYFRDSNGTNIFIETRLNADTNRTGLFCAYDIDKAETDYRNGLLDLLGNHLVSGISDEIEFFSYKETITESLSFPNVSLDTPGNVTFFGDQATYSNTSCLERRATNADNYFTGLTYSGVDYDSAYPSVGTASLTVSFGAEGTGDICGSTMSSYVIVGGEKKYLSSTSFAIAPTDFILTSGAAGHSQDFEKVFIIDTDGIIKTDPTSAQLANGIVLGYVDITITVDTNNNPYFSKFDYIPVSVDENGFVPLKNGTDFSVTLASSNDTITYEFTDTSGTINVTDYIKYRRYKAFLDVVNIINGDNSEQAVILVDQPTISNGGHWKISVSDLTWTFVTTTTSNKSITIKFPTTHFNTYPSSILLYGLAIHPVDNEFIVGNQGMITTNDYSSSNTGVCAKYSTLYTYFTNGLINTGDYFYENLVDGSTSEPTGLNTVEFLDNSGTDYIVTSEALPLSNGDIINVPASTLNTGNFTIANNVPVSTGLTVSFSPYYAYEVVENTVAEVLTDVTEIWDMNQIHYLKMYRDSDGILTVNFTDSTYTSISTTYNTNIKVVSQDSNFKQTVEIEVPAGYTEVTNKILVDSTRYTEVKVGDFLEAYVDEDNLVTGEDPRRMTRIINKKTYSGDSTLIELTCDSAIKKYDFGGDKQTNRFTSIDDYVTTYKALPLSGFKIREDSLPNGTDDRLSEILSIIGLNTPLFKAITDKDNFTFRYLVDSFGLGLTELSKKELVSITGTRNDAFGIINLPSMKQFKNSSSPSFVDENGVLRTDYIAKGGNPDSAPAFLFSLAEDGATTAGYFTPYVKVNDNGRPKDVPPAAWVATTYLRKHNEAIVATTPWTIAAGITDGQITSIAGLEVLFNGDNISDLNGMKVNPIVTKRNRGYVIETENTALTLYKSSLSFIHVREVLIELEKELYDMLLSFQWKYNTPEIRAEIKLRADAICETFVNRNGLYNFFNKCDAENNTNEIIDNQFGVLDTYVEPIKGMGIIVNNITILKTGDIESGGFTL